MDKEEIKEYLESKPCAVYEYKAEWGCFRAMLFDKMFAFIGSDNKGTPILNLKCEPALAVFLRADYPNKIIPGYYSNKDHWNSLLYEELDADLVKRLIDQSYDLIKAALPKSKRETLK